MIGTESFNFFHSYNQLNYKPIRSSLLQIPHYFRPIRCQALEDGSGPLSDEQLSIEEFGQKVGYIRGLGRGRKPNATLSRKRTHAQLERDNEAARKEAEEQRRVNEELVGRIQILESDLMEYNAKVDFLMQQINRRGPLTDYKVLDAAKVAKKQAFFATFTAANRMVSRSVLQTCVWGCGWIRKWWDWGCGWILSRKPTFARDLEMNEQETVVLGCHSKGSWRHVFDKLRKLLVRPHHNLPQTFRVLLNGWLRIYRRHRREQEMMQSDVVEEIIYGLESGILFG
ncbi:unnamed protein product [Camellia sinensis]